MGYFRKLAIRRKMREVLKKIPALKPKDGLDFLKQKASEFVTDTEALEKEIHRQLGDNPFLVVYFHRKEIKTVGEVFIAHLLCEGMWWYIFWDGKDSMVTWLPFESVDDLAHELANFIITSTGWTAEIMIQRLRMIIGPQIEDKQTLLPIFDSNIIS